MTGDTFKIWLGSSLAVLLAAPPAACAFERDYALSHTSVGIPGGRATDGQLVISGSVGTIVAYASDLVYNLSPSTSNQSVIEGIKFRSGLNDTIIGDDWPLSFKLQRPTSGPDCDVHYRPGGAIEYASVSMDIENGVYTTAVPTGNLGGRGLEYYLEFSKGSHRLTLGTAERPFRSIEFYETGYDPPLNLSPGRYQIISVPLAMDGQSASTIFEGEFGEYDPTVWRLGRFDSFSSTVHEYPDVPTARAGISYWLITASDVTFAPSGYTVLPNLREDSLSYYSIPLDSGWNQVANPFLFNIAWKNIRFEKAGVIFSQPTQLVEDSIFGYFENGFRSQSVLFPWHGVFLFARQSGLNILFPCHAFSPTPETKEYAESSSEIKNQSVTLRFVDDAGITQLVFLGICDSFDLGENVPFLSAPPTPTGSILALKLPGQMNYSARSDYRRPNRNGYQFEFEIRTDRFGLLNIGPTAQALAQFAITLDGLHRSIDILDCLDGIEIPPGRHHFTLQLKNTETNAESLPERFALYQNYPNPFNLSTTIRYDLPSQSSSDLTIFNIVGQTVFRKHIEDQQPGRHAIAWNGHDRKGNEVSSGLYFVRMQSGNFTASRKMLLLR